MQCINLEEVRSNIDRIDNENKTDSREKKICYASY